MTDFNDPVERYKLIERVGVEEYNRQLREWHKQNTVETVNGYPIRKVGSRFGPLYLVVGADKAFHTLGEARSCALSQEAKR